MGLFARPQNCPGADDRAAPGHPGSAVTDARRDRRCRRAR